MYLVVGLGNPGREYEATRHNMGFDTIDHLVEDYNVPQGGVKFNAMYGKTMIGGEKVILMKPLSFMNLSGGPVREMANYFKIDPESELIVIYDDIDLEPGQLRIRKQGSAGGHNGIKDIIRQLGTEKFLQEAVIHQSLPVWGVQWHPERLAGPLSLSGAADGGCLFTAWLALAGGTGQS